MSDFYILDDDGETPIWIDGPDALRRWGAWIETAERHVADTTVEGVRISTVFMGLDYNFSGVGKPILWETMVFAPEGLLPHDAQEQERYTSAGDAREGHECAVAYVRDLLTRPCPGRAVCESDGLVECRCYRPTAPVPYEPPTSVPF